MQAVDTTQTKESIESQLNSIKTYNETSAAQKKSESSTGNVFQQANKDISSQLNKISESQKRFQRNVPNSMDSLLDFMGITGGGSGQTETYKYIRKKMIEVAVKIEPQIQDLILKQAVKAIGCSQEQTYEGFSFKNQQFDSLDSLPQSEGIYIPVQSVDIFGALKNSDTSLYGLFYYEKLYPGLVFRPSISSDEVVTLTYQDFIPYGGRETYPMNRELYNLTIDPGKSYKTKTGYYYQGESNQPLFDIQYTNTNELNVSGDYFRVLLLDREDSNGKVFNNVGNLLADYYKTLDLIDPVVIMANCLNAIAGSINSNASYQQLDEQSKFFLLIERILGLCFDNREEIDVSGVSKIAELDGVDESFFEFTEVDLRKIDVIVQNIQNGIIEFTDCDNVKLPVDNSALNQQLITFRGKLYRNSDNDNVEEMSKIFDSISQNPAWAGAGLQVETSLNKNIIKKLATGVAAGVLTPKVLLPVFVLLAVVQNKASANINQAITDTNEIISSANTEINAAISNGNEANNLVLNSLDFIKKFRTFTIDLVSKIGAIFVRALFEELKKDIINLLGIIVKDITKASSERYKRMILKLVDIVEILALVVLTLNDARKCKNLLDRIKKLIATILTKAGFTPPIPIPLLFLADALPGYSAERATANVIEFMQKSGLPTGPLPDGSPNRMTQFVSAVLRGQDLEQSTNSKLSAIGTPTPAGFIKISGKSI